MAEKTSGKDPLHVTDREAWRKWLLEHHASQGEAWLVFNKKHTGAQTLSYEEAVEEALCFGWIDSIARKIDDRKYMQKFTPRRKKSEWSEINKKRARKMIKQGKMAEAGRAKIKEAKADGRWGKVRFRESPVRIPPELREALKSDPEIRDRFDSYTPAYKKMLIGWIQSPRMQETRERRMEEVIELIAQGKKLGMK